MGPRKNVESFQVQYANSGLLTQKNKYQLVAIPPFSRKKRQAQQQQEHQIQQQQEEQAQQQQEQQAQQHQERQVQQQQEYQIQQQQGRQVQPQQQEEHRHEDEMQRMMNSKKDEEKMKGIDIFFYMCLCFIFPYYRSRNKCKKTTKYQ
jgi:hypothetical protein